jgi:hypothetical protein
MRQISPDGIDARLARLPLLSALDPALQGKRGNPGWMDPDSIVDNTYN